MFNEGLSLELGRSKTDLVRLLLSTSFDLMGSFGGLVWIVVFGFVYFHLHRRQIRVVCVLCLFKLSFAGFAVRP